MIVHGLCFSVLRAEALSAAENTIRKKEKADAREHAKTLPKNPRGRPPKNTEDMKTKETKERGRSRTPKPKAAPLNKAASPKRKAKKTKNSKEPAEHENGSTAADIEPKETKDDNMKPAPERKTKRKSDATDSEPKRQAGARANLRKLKTKVPQKASQEAAHRQQETEGENGQRMLIAFCKGKSCQALMFPRSWLERLASLKRTQLAKDVQLGLFSTVNLSMWPSPTHRIVGQPPVKG